jgi:hypothetical protein
MLGGGVELVGDRDEGDAVAVEDVNQLGKIRERSRQPIDLVHDDHVNPVRLNVG